MAMARVWRLIWERVPLKRNFLTMVRRGEAAAMKTSPTGFSGVPPEGPAMPVVATAKVASRLRRMPCAMALATGALTAPWRRIRAGATFRSADFAVSA